MPYFASVAAVRIQSWLARTPELRYVRGASRALQEATQRETDRQGEVPLLLAARAGLPDGVHSDTDSPDVDGVCVLRSDDQDALDEGVDRLLNYLQRRLPGAEWTAWRTEASSYVVAYDAVHGGGAHSSAIKRWPRRLPLTLDLPFAAPCARCSFELATRSVPVPGAKDQKTVGIGPDCVVRRDAGLDLTFTDFDELARQGRHQSTVGRRDATNHLATICADGNRVGDFFAAVAALNEPNLQTELSRAVDAAIHAAVADAECCGPQGANGETLPISIRHFVGGDDVFVSVAAGFAWLYVERLGREFERDFTARVEKAFETADAARQAGATGFADDRQIQKVRKAAERVSLAIGIAFANSSYPIADCRESALEAERFAKRATGGNSSAVSWLDITVEPSIGQGGGRIPPGRWVAIGTLTGDLADPHPALVMPASARNVLVTLLRPRAEESAADIARAVRAWALRVDRLSELEPYLPGEDGSDCEGRIGELRHTVDRARWWPRREEQR